MKIHQCHLCNRVLGTKLIPCPDCQSGMKEVFQFFELKRGLTKEEGERYGKSILKLFKPTGRNRFKENQFLNFTSEEMDLLNDVLCDAIMHHQLGWERYSEGSEESDYHDKAHDLCIKLFDFFFPKEDSECAHQGVYEDKVDDFYTITELGNRFTKPLSKKAYLHIRGAFVGFMNDLTVTEQEKMGVDLCLMALDAYYEYKNDFDLKVQYPVEEDGE